MIFKGSALVAGAMALALTLGFSACSTSHDASDPEYGQMFKQATRDRVTGNEFWGSNSQKDCTAGGAIEICTPKGSKMSSN